MNEPNKTLYLVRHAKSSWKDESLSDIDRPLNKRGNNNAPDMGRRMAAQGHRPDLIISSPANRALATARSIATELAIDLSEIRIDENLYFSGSNGMLDALEKVDDRFGKVMMVGHNPTVTHLANLLTDSNISNMPTCAIAIIGFNIESWDEARCADTELLGYDTPKGTGKFKQ